MRPSLPLVEPLQRALHLRSVDMFAELTAPDLAAIARLMHEQWLRSGDSIYDRGQRVRAVHLLVEGRVRLEQPDGKAQLLEAPDGVGILELLAGSETTARAVVQSNALALAIDGGALIDLIEDHFPIFLEMRRALGRQMAEKHGHLGIGAWPAREIREPERLPPSPSGLAEQLIWLHRVPELRPFGVGVLASLLRERADVHFEAGESIWNRGDESECLLLVVDGTVRCRSGDAKEELRGGTGSLWGMDEVFAGLPHSSDLAAETAVTAIRVEASVLLDLAEDHFHVATEILGHCARTLLLLQRSGSLGGVAGGSAPTGS